MKLTQLIAELQKILVEKGDLDVGILTPLNLDSFLFSWAIGADISPSGKLAILHGAMRKLANE